MCACVLTLYSIIKKETAKHYLRIEATDDDDDDMTILSVAMSRWCGQKSMAAMMYSLMFSGVCGISKMMHIQQ